MQGNTTDEAAARETDRKRQCLDLSRAGSFPQASCDFGEFSVNQPLYFSRIGLNQPLYFSQKGLNKPLYFAARIH